MRQILFFTILLLSTSSYGQLQQENVDILSELLLEKINDLRQEQELLPLTLDTSLILAADFHATFMTRVNRLTHKQPVRKYRTPFDRVAKYSDEFKWVGENILFVEHKRKRIKDDELKEIALQMFLSWKNSPGHYRNMVNTKYELTGFAFRRNKNGKIYAANVFGTKGVKIRGQISKNAFGIRKGGDECREFMQHKANLLTNVGNSIQIYGNHVWLYYHDRQLIEDLLSNPKDGFAVDIVSRDQFSCESENQLDISEIYDGVLLKPVYEEELFRENQAQSDFRVISEIGDIPASIVDKDIRANLIYIKNEKQCSYNIPGTIPSSRYSLVDVEPRIFNPGNYPLYYRGIVHSETHYFNFERGATLPDKFIPVNKDKGEIMYVYINSYSSVEGDSVSNDHLQTKRADYIKDMLKKNLGKQLSQAILEVQKEENWELCKFQLEMLGLNKMKKSSHDAIKNFIANDTIHNWDSLLYIQRRSFAIIEYEDVLNTKDSMYYSYNLYTAIKKKEWNIANKSMVMIKQMKEWGGILFEPTIFEQIMIQPQLVQNASALLLNSYYMDTEKCIRFIRKWIDNSLINDDAKFNLCILYSNLVSDLLQDWDVNSKVFAKLITPEVIKKTIEEYTGDEHYGKLILNYHLTAISYYGQINDNDGIRNSFDFISNYFKSRVLDIEDEISLCLFYNSWSRYDLTINNLFKRMNRKDFNENATFILAQTCMAYDQLNDDEKLMVMKKAFEFNKDRWCEWIKQEFQNQRHLYVKEIYCKECLMHEEGFGDDVGEIIQ